MATVRHYATSRKVAVSILNKIDRVLFAHSFQSLHFPETNSASKRNK
jgi:hypothetical protein